MFQWYFDFQRCFNQKERLLYNPHLAIPDHKYAEIQLGELEYDQTGAFPVIFQNIWGRQSTIVTSVW